MSAGLTQLIRSLALMTLIKNLGRHMPKERDFLQPEITLAKLGIQLMLSQLL
jgi:hypothetical protein